MSEQRLKLRCPLLQIALIVLVEGVGFHGFAASQVPCDADLPHLVELRNKLYKQGSTNNETLTLTFNDGKSITGKVVEPPKGNTATIDHIWIDEGTGSSPVLVSLDKVGEVKRSPQPVVNFKTGAEHGKARKERVRKDAELKARDPAESYSGGALTVGEYLDLEKYWGDFAMPAYVEKSHSEVLQKAWGNPAADADAFYFDQGNMQKVYYDKNGHKDEVVKILTPNDVNGLTPTKIPGQARRQVAASAFFDGKGLPVVKYTASADEIAMGATHQKFVHNSLSFDTMLEAAGFPKGYKLKDVDLSSLSDFMKKYSAYDEKLREYFELKGVSISQYDSSNNARKVGADIKPDNFRFIRKRPYENFDPATMIEVKYKGKTTYFKAVLVDV